MYKQHDIFIQPGNEEVKVWKYMDFKKLISLIETGCLFFTRADKFNDPFEGSYPKINTQVAGPHMSEFHKQWRRYAAINCWHMNEHESDAMWKLYRNGDEGVAIQSTYSRLKKSLTDEQGIFLGIVKYIDYETEYVDSMDSGNVIPPFVHKRKSFEHEREVRAVMMKCPPRNDKGGTHFEENTIDFGVEIQTNLEVLIEKIYVAPNSPPWFSKLVKLVLIRYGYDFDVIHSRLDDNPYF
jgi:hypothetical protein